MAQYTSSYGNTPPKPQPPPTQAAGFPQAPIPSPGSAQRYPNPLDDPDAWDSFILAGNPSPGRAIVSAAAAKRKLDKKAGHGSSGATVTYSGDDISDFSVTLELIETEDWDAWWQWRGLLVKPPKGTRATSLACSHPALLPLGITACMVETEHQPEPSGDEGMWTVKIDFVQWQKPTPSLGTPKGSGYVASYGGSSTQDFINDLEHEKKQILDAVRKRAGGLF